MKYEIIGIVIVMVILSGCTGDDVDRANYSSCCTQILDDDGEWTSDEYSCGGDNGTFYNLTSAMLNVSNLTECPRLEDNPCIQDACIAMICGKEIFQIKPVADACSIRSMMNNIDDGNVAGSDFETAKELFKTKCEFVALNSKEYRAMNSQGLWINSFRFGIGESFEDFEEARLYFPISDSFCAMGIADGWKDRYLNYLNMNGSIISGLCELSGTDWNCTEDGRLFEPFPDSMTAKSNCESYCNVKSGAMSACITTEDHPLFLGPYNTSNGVENSGSYNNNGELIYYGYTSCIDEDDDDNSVVCENWMKRNDDVSEPTIISNMDVIDLGWYKQTLTEQYKSQLITGHETPEGVTKPGLVFECTNAGECMSGMCNKETYDTFRCINESNISISDIDCKIKPSPWGGIKLNVINQSNIYYVPPGRCYAGGHRSCTGDIYTAWYESSLQTVSDYEPVSFVEGTPFSFPAFIFGNNPNSVPLITKCDMEEETDYEVQTYELSPSESALTIGDLDDDGNSWCTQAEDTDGELITPEHINWDDDLTCAIIATSRIKITGNGNCSDSSIGTYTGEGYDAGCNNNGDWVDCKVIETSSSDEEHEGFIIKHHNVINVVYEWDSSNWILKNYVRSRSMLSYEPSYDSDEELPFYVYTTQPSNIPLIDACGASFSTETINTVWSEIDDSYSLITDSDDTSYTVGDLKTDGSSWCVLADGPAGSIERDDILWDDDLTCEAVAHTRIEITDLGNCYENDSVIKYREYGWCEPCTELTMAVQELGIGSQYCPAGYTYDSEGDEYDVTKSNCKLSKTIKCSSDSVGTALGGDRVPRCNSCKEGPKDGWGDYRDCFYEGDYDADTPSSIESAVPDVTPQLVYINELTEKYQKSNVLPIFIAENEELYEIVYDKAKIICIGDITNEVCMSINEYEGWEFVNSRDILYDIREITIRTNGMPKFIKYEMLGDGASIVIVGNTEDHTPDKLIDRATIVKRSCPTCLTSVHAKGKLNAAGTINKVDELFGYDSTTFETPRIFLNQTAMDNIDIISYDFYPDDYGATDPNESVKIATDFSRTLLQHYSKPSLILNFHIVSPLEEEQTALVEFSVKDNNLDDCLGNSNDHFGCGGYRSDEDEYSMRCVREELNEGDGVSCETGSDLLDCRLKIVGDGWNSEKCGPCDNERAGGVIVEGSIDLSDIISDESEVIEVILLAQYGDDAIGVEDGGLTYTNFWMEDTNKHDIDAWPIFEINNHGTERLINYAKEIGEETILNICDGSGEKRCDENLEHEIWPAYSWEAGAWYGAMDGVDLLGGLNTPLNITTKSDNPSSYTEIIKFYTTIWIGEGSDNGNSPRNECPSFSNQELIRTIITDYGYEMGPDDDIDTWTSTIRSNDINARIYFLVKYQTNTTTSINVKEYYSYIFENQDLLTEVGIIGIIYDDWKGGSDTYLVINNTKKDNFCALQEESKKLIGYDFLEVTFPVDGTPELCECQETHYGGLGSSPICLDGEMCDVVDTTVSGGCTPFCVREDVCRNNLCNETSGTVHCEVHNMYDGTIESYFPAEGINISNLTEESGYGIIIGQLADENKCCFINEESNTTYTYALMETLKPTNELIIFPWNGDPNLGCNDKITETPEDEDFPFEFNVNHGNLVCWVEDTD